jgi:HprK-related kinase A
VDSRLRGNDGLRVSDLDDRTLGRNLSREGLGLCLGPFTVRLRSPLASIRRAVARLYPHHHLADLEGFIDFDIAVRPVGLPWRKGAQFLFESNPPFAPLPQAQAPALLEWGLNWCIAGTAHHFLILHAAALARGEDALILPGASGCGKSTLCAALLGHGWRLLSDELALLRPADGMLIPLPRPLSLKNGALALLPEAVLSEPITSERKGVLALMRPPADSVAAAALPARPRWVVFPHYAPGSATLLRPETSGLGFMALARNAFNYATLGEAGFAALADMAEAVSFHHLDSGNLDEAVGILNGL